MILLEIAASEANFLRFFKPHPRLIQYNRARWKRTWHHTQALCDNLARRGIGNWRNRRGIIGVEREMPAQRPSSKHLRGFTQSPGDRSIYQGCIVHHQSALHPWQKSHRRDRSSSYRCNKRMCRLITNSILFKLCSFFVCIGEKEEHCSLYEEIACNTSHSKIHRCW